MCTINHDKKAIFINIPKTGRTYVSINLVKHYGFTEYLNQRPDHKEYCDTKQQLGFFNKKKGILQYYKTSPELNKIMGMDDEKWNTYTKFCFVREPFERSLSAYNYIQSTQSLEKLIEHNKTKQVSRLDFDKFVELYNYTDDFTYMHAFMPQYENMIDEKGNIFMTYIGSFDNLEEDFQHILNLLGIFDIVHEKTHLNVVNYEKNINMKQKSIDIIRMLYHKDFENVEIYNSLRPLYNKLS